MSYAITREVVLAEIHCGACDITFAVPYDWMANRKATGEGWYCPNGHARVFRDPENARLRRQLDAANGRARHLEDQREAAERSAAAYKGQVTRIKKRIGNGVCPCCKRSFQNVARHMATKHPDYAEGDT